MNLDGRSMFGLLRGYKGISKVDFSEPDEKGNL